jgi:hypothetical protein
MQDAHLVLHMDPNLVFANTIQTFYNYMYLHHFFPIPMVYIYGCYINQQNCGIENS